MQEAAKKSGANFQILVDGKSLSYRDGDGAGVFLKERHPHTAVVSPTWAAAASGGMGAAWAATPEIMNTASINTRRGAREREFILRKFHRAPKG